MIQDDYSRNNFNELRSDLDADAVSRNSIYNSRSNTGGAGPQNSRKMRATNGKKSVRKSVSNNRAHLGKVGGRHGAENSRMESMMSKHNHTRQSHMFGDTMISDNISDITYRSKSCLRRGCCQERGKIAKDLERKNRKRASQVQKSSIIEARGGSGNGLGGGG